MRTHEMSNEQQIQEIEVTMKQMQVEIDRMAAFERLTANKDFQMIIEQDYFINHASRLVLLLATPAMQDDFKQKDIQDDIVGIGRLRQYFVGLMNKGHMAQKSMSEHEAELEALNAEDLS